MKTRPRRRAARRRRAAPSARALEKLPDNVGVVEKLGERVPRDLVFTDENGKRVHLGDYLADGKPVLIALVYYKCPMLCSLTLNGVVGALRQQTWKLGQEYRVVTVSFDPDEKPELARAEAARLPRRARPHARGARPRIGRSSPATRRNIDALSDALGFKFRWDDVNKTLGPHRRDHGARRPTARSRATSTACSIRRATCGWRSSRPPTARSAPRSNARSCAATPMTPRPRAIGVFAVRFVRVGALLVLGMLVILLDPVVAARPAPQSRGGSPS